MIPRYNTNRKSCFPIVKAALEKKFGLVGHPKADLLFELAGEWYYDDLESNCDSGDLEPYYASLVDLVK